ncbi:MAG: helix-turn-helix domain-containing protein [Butyricimonas virosa]|uniref:helix-turn-helix domain-containing protein n=1 Tax=Butyricimonas virosa TaxID=544645 RepID=UPI00242C1078|nr:helix-turn-helix transcriptional regulator [Butyricimonas virosa]MCI7161768.1 helix-turn-helix domain-containing protein [Butyricimonas virosa]
MKSKIELYTIAKVKEFRAKADNMSIRYFADCLNVDHAFICRIEDETTDKAYNLDHLNEIAKILKCNLWDLIPKKPL